MRESFSTNKIPWIALSDFLIISVSFLDIIVLQCLKDILARDKKIKLKVIFNLARR